MSKDKTSERRENKNIELRASIDKILQESKEFLQYNFDNLELHNYKYTPHEAIDELGLDADLVNQLLEDYVIQIVKSKALFIKYLQELKTAKKLSKELDYTPLRELAHKNLGVARNLRILDAIKVLEKLMKKNNLDNLILYVEALESCAIRLKPKRAYETLNLISIKNSL